MRIAQIYDLLREQGIRPLKTEAKINNLAILRYRSGEEEKLATAEIKRQMSATLITHFAHEVMHDADWNMLQTPDGLEIRVQTYMLTQKQVCDILREAYILGRREAPLKDSML